MARNPTSRKIMTIQASRRELGFTGSTRLCFAMVNLFSRVCDSPDAEDLAEHPHGGDAEYEQ